jgi:hypothetical protein
VVLNHEIYLELYICFSCQESFIHFIKSFQHAPTREHLQICFFLVSIKFRQRTNMVHILILRFLLVLFSLNLIEHYHSMEKKTNFDFELDLFRNLIKESKSWIVDTQKKSWIKEIKNEFLYELLPQSSRSTSIRPQFDQETEINYSN